MEVRFTISRKDKALAQAIAKRASALYRANGVKGFFTAALHIEMDLTACHANGCRMDFERLTGADDFNLMHDVVGIRDHLNRETGKLERLFLPRFAKRPPFVRGRAKTPDLPITRDPKWREMPAS